MVASEKAVPPELRNKMDQAKIDAEVRDYQNRLLDLLKDKVAFAKLIPVYVRAYDETFSGEEIRGILAFYKSPVGQAFLEKNPSLTSKIMQLSRSRAMELLPEVHRMHTAWVDELKNKYGDSGDPSE